jgi:type I restriction enzyme S subunit
MKAGWKTVKFGEVARYDKAQGAHSGLPYVGLEHIESGTRKHIGPRIDTEVQSSTFLFNPKHVLYGRLRPYLRKVLVPEFAGHCSTEIFPILPSSELDRSFLSYWLISESTTSAIDRLCNGARMPRANMEQALELEIPLPPLAEQKRIVALLDEAFAGIDEAKAKTEEILERIQALFESHLQSIFTQRGPGWVERRLGELSRINYGYTESASSEKIGPHFLRITDIQDDGVDWNTVPYCPIDKSDLPKYKLADGDIVFARTGATTGKSYLVSNPPDSVFASYLIRVQLSDEALIPGFLYLFFQTRSYWDVIRAGVSGSAQGGFNASKLGELTIPYPASLNDQKAVIHSIREIRDDTLKAGKLSNRKLQALAELKESLLAQAFAGELTA